MAWTGVVPNLSLDVFWRSTRREVMAAIKGYIDANTPADKRPLDEDEMNELARRHPDAPRQGARR